MTIIEKKRAELLEIKAEQELLGQEIEFFQQELLDSPASKLLNMEIAERQKKIIPQRELVEYEHRIYGIYEKYIKPFKLNWYYPGDEFALARIRSKVGDMEYMPSGRSLKSVRFSNLRLFDARLNADIYEGLPTSQDGYIPFSAFNELDKNGNGNDLSQMRGITEDNKVIYFGAGNYEKGQEVYEGFIADRNSMFVGDIGGGGLLPNSTIGEKLARKCSIQMILFNEVNAGPLLEFRFNPDSNNFADGETVQDLWAYVPEYIEESV